MKKQANVFFGIFIIFSIIILGYIYFRINNESIVPSVSSPLYIPKQSLSTDNPVTFTIAGDVMLGRAIAWKHQSDLSQTFANLGQNYFAATDVGLINLEGPVSPTNLQTNPNPDNLIFNFPPQSIDALKFLGVNAASLANNHSENQGTSGLITTRQLLTNASIVPIGSQSKFDKDSVKQFGRLTIIAVNLTGKNYDITSEIKTEKDNNQTVLIFPHWGSEYQVSHSRAQAALAHQWIDAGADLVIGSHPHVVQDAEIYKNKLIFYSLGNLIFDQNFSEGTQHGLIIKGSISKNNTTITLLPTTITNYQVGLNEGNERLEVINKFRQQLPNVSWQDDTMVVKQN